MNLYEMKKSIAAPAYDFLTQRRELGDNIIMLGIGGSHAYGTDTDGSDLDIRGMAANTRDCIYLCNPFEQSIDVETDTTIYSLDKSIRLFCSCNPNTIELLGLKPEHYLYVNDIGRRIIENREIFLSKRAIYTFGGYANSQLRRLENKSAKTATQEKEEQYILRSIESATEDFKRRYFEMPDDSIRLYIDRAVNENFNTEIFMDISLRHYPLRDYKDMISEMQSIVRSYRTIGRRNENAVTHNKISKHMMHLVRLYIMCIDILKYGVIVTYREKEHDLLMDIRNGKFLDDAGQPRPEFYELVDTLEAQMQAAKESTELPDNPDMKKVNRLLYEINESICQNGTALNANEQSFTQWRRGIQYGQAMDM